MKPVVQQLRVVNSTGFSLVEVLVGMAIALIGIVIMFQMMENTETRKRTTASGGDAQVAGSIAMYNLERDIRLAGYGFGNSTSLGCTVNAYDACVVASPATMGCNGTPRSLPAFTFPLVPLMIIDGAGGAPDQIVSFYGSSPTMPINQAFDTSSTSSKRAASTSTRAGLLRGELVLVTNGASCGLVEITDNTNADVRTVNHVVGAYTNSQNVAATARFNDPAGFTTASGLLHNLGDRNVPRRNIWQIVNRRTLTVSDDLHSTAAAEVGEGIINLQAQYGLDTTPIRDYLVDTWQSATPADWTRVIAVRVALLARSQQYEKAAVPNYSSCATTVALDPTSCQRPSWAGGNFTMADLDSVDYTTDTNPDSPNDWRHYRYRIYQTTIPLRNMIWGTAP